MVMVTSPDDRVSSWTKYPKQTNKLNKNENFPRKLIKTWKFINIRDLEDSSQKH